MTSQNEYSKLFNDFLSRICRYKQEFEKAIDDNTDGINIHIYYQLKDVQEALELTDEDVAIAYTSLGSDLHKKDYVEAYVIAIFEEAIRIDSQVAAAYSALGTIFYKRGNKKAAFEKLEKAKSLFIEQGMSTEAEKIEQSIRALHRAKNFGLHIINVVKNQLTGSTESFESNYRNDQEMKEMKHRVARVEKRTTSTSTYTFENVKFGGGFAGTDGTQTGGILNDYSSNPNLSQAAEEIQEILKQLSETNPTTTNTEKMRVVTQAVEQIENDPPLKERVITALHSTSVDAFQQEINHPLAKKLLASIEE